MTQENSNLTGRLHSYETLGTLDGPGLRLVVFLQGCPLRCLYCHNPDTWNLKNGREVTVAEIVAKAQRMRPYFGAAGGVTLSGGEPLAQPPFTLALLKALRDAGIHTVLDTSGMAVFSAIDRDCGNDVKVLRQILSLTDLVLLDIKAPTDAGFKALTGREIRGLTQFLELANEQRQKLWIRQVIVPGINDTSEDMAALGHFLATYAQLHVEKVELLPYHTLGVSKYDQLDKDYPLPDTGPMPVEKLAFLQTEINQWLLERNKSQPG